MTRKLLFSSKFNGFLTLLFLLLFSINTTAQCAGDDGVLSDVCDIANPTSKTINLFAGLGGSPLTGGIWTDTNKSGGLDKNTGILNAQLIKKSGIYNYTYTVSGVPGCADNTAVVTVTIGGYTGVAGPNVSICTTKSAYNLFEAFNGNFLEPQRGGTWFGNTTNTGLSGNLLNAINLSDGVTYEYTYSISAIGSCPAPPDVKVYITVFRSPQSGIPNDLLVCSNQLSAYTNLNLNDRLQGEDAGGMWTENTTNEIDNTDPNDSFIDVQNIYNTRGPGTYRFTYTAFTDNNVCQNQTSNVDITIERLLDYTGAILSVNSSICESDIGRTLVQARISDVVNIPDGRYTITYTVSGAANSMTTTQDFVNNVLIFPIAPNNFSSVGDYTITVTNIVSANTLGICNNIIPNFSAIIKITPIPKIDNATLTLAPICQDNEAIVQFSGTSNLSDGLYDIVYNLSGSNILNGVPATIDVVGGISSFVIPAAFIGKSGTTKITISKIINTTTGCINTATLNGDLIINPRLDLPSLNITVENVCINQETEVNVTGLGNLTSVTVSYDLSGSNIAGTTLVTFPVALGKGTFSIPSSKISLSGDTTFTILSVTNAITGCMISLNKTKIFTVYALPDPTTTDLKFCESENATVAQLIPQGNQYQWFDSNTSTTPLPNTTVLNTGTYFVKEKNLTTSCESVLKPANVQVYISPEINNAVLRIDAVCPSSDVIVNFEGPSNLADGDYKILYSLTGTNTASGISDLLRITNGVGFFKIPSTLIPNSGSTTLVINRITNAVTNCFTAPILSQFFDVKPLPDALNLVVIIKDVCLGQGATIELEGLQSLNKIDLSYTITGKNSVSLQTISLDVVNGKVNFTILPTNLTTAGVSNFTISAITNSISGCTLLMNKITNFTVNDTPDISSLRFVVKDVCPNQSMIVEVSGLGLLTKVLFDYTLLSPSKSTNFQTQSLNVVGGNTTFAILGSELSTTGAYTFTLNDITNGVTNCSKTTISLSQNFNVLPIPATPTALDQAFCKENLNTVANLVPNGLQYKWYNSATSTQSLLPTTPLVTGTYFLRELNGITGCQSNATSINVLINSVPIPILNSDGQLFCGADKPTIQNLTDNTNFTGTLTWYNSSNKVNALSNTDLLVEGVTYYGVDYNNTTKCVSLPLEVTVSLSSCNITPDGLIIPDGFSPNGDGINDTFEIRDIEYLFPNFSLEIYNRYGNVLFKGNSSKPAWDGKNSNSSFINGDAPTGVYFYIINYNKGNLSPRQGQLYLNR